MKVYTRMMTNTSFKDVEIDPGLALIIEHDGVRYTLSEDNSGELILRVISKVQLIIHPKASNSIEIKAEK